MVRTEIELLDRFQALPLGLGGCSEERASLPAAGTQGCHRAQRPAAPGEPGQTYCGDRLLPGTRRGHGPGPWCHRESPRVDRAPPAAASCSGTGRVWGRRVGTAHLQKGRTRVPVTGGDVRCGGRAKPGPARCIPPVPVPQQRPPSSSASTSSSAAKRS